MFLMLPFFLIIFILPEKTMAQTGTISGTVYSYSSTSTGLQGVTVTAYDKMNNQKGSKTTDSKGKYTITGLSTGQNNDYYRVCAVKSGYVIECYQKPDSSCSGRDCGFYWIVEEDPNKMQGSLVDLETKSTATGINFYLARGGKIEGNISGSNSNYSYQVILEGDIKYKNREPVLNKKFPLNKTNNYFFNDINTFVIPPGTYTLRTEDSSSTFRYYTTVYYDGQTGTYDPKNAKTFTYLLDKTTKFTANFTIKKGGIINGQVMEKFQGQYVGINEARVAVTEKSLGLSFEEKTEIVIDPNTEIAYEGVFVISGLPPGAYILRTDDSYIPDANSRFYLPEYYNNVYFEDQATPITISEAAINKSDYEGTYIEIILQHCPTVKGWVIDYEPSLCNSNQYNINKALDNIKIEMIPNFQGETIYTQTGPEGLYTYKKSDKILPGPYIIKARDSSCTYFNYEKNITVAPATEYTVNFCLAKVPSGSGKMSISGHVFRNENPNCPLSGVELAAVNTNTTPYEYYYSSTNPEGEFLFADLNCGEYNLVAGGDYEDLIKELYKGVCILDEDQFVEGKKYTEIESSVTKILIYPGEDLKGIDIGLSSYKYTFKSGLNLFGYPGLPVEKYDHTNEFCSQLGSAMNNFRGKDPDTGQWYVITTSNLQSNPEQIRIGQGYIIYMKNQAGPIFFPPFKTMPPKFYNLDPGKNLIAYPASLHYNIKKSSDLLKKLGTQDEVASVHSFDNASGKWKSTVWLWGKPSASAFLISQGEGYLAEMRVYNTVETESPNIVP